MKTIVSEKRILLDRIHCRLAITEETISRLQCTDIEIIQSEKHMEIKTIEREKLAVGNYGTTISASYMKSWNI
jgi:hypothetical protein